MVEGRVVDSSMNGFYNFAGNLFAVLVYYLEEGDIGSGMVVVNNVLVDFTGDMTIVFFHLIFQTFAKFFYVG